jgi:outer membrane protein TolC
MTSSRLAMRALARCSALLGLLICAALPSRGQATGGASAGTTGYAPEASHPSLARTPEPFQGSVPAGEAVPGVLPLSLPDALKRGLQHNLGLLVSADATQSARGEQWRALSLLLPNVSAQLTENRQQLNLATFGISAPGFPKIVGPFSVFDIRGYFSQRLVDMSSVQSARAAAAGVSAAEYSYKDARDLVVLVVSNEYLLTIAAAARVDAAVAQLTTAQSLYTRAQDLLKSGLIPSIDELRARVEMQTRQQQLIVGKNDLAKQKLNLARVIGLAAGQEFLLTDPVPYAPLALAALDEDLKRAFASRPDYQSALARVRAAQLNRSAAKAERLPSILFNADYGDTGLTPGNSHGTFSLAGTLRVPIFQGGHTHGDVLAADAIFKQRQSELADLRGRIDYQIRTARMDLQAAGDQVEVAKSSLELAGRTLTQAQDRFAAGVVDNLEVVQAQETLANANENYISSVYAYNLSKVMLARATGLAEQSVMQYLGGK